MFVRRCVSIGGAFRPHRVRYLSMMARSPTTMMGSMMSMPPSVPNHVDAVDEDDGDGDGDGDMSYDVMAVPKKKTSLYKRRLRWGGHRARNASRAYLPYRVCSGCGNPVRSHFVCLACLDKDSQQHQQPQQQDQA